MVMIKLEDNLKLGITEIDSQHETLVSLVNLLHENMLQGSGKAILDDILSQLLKHTETHFAYEEKLMTRYDYPDYEKHKEAHDRLIQQLIKLITLYKKGDLLLSFAIVLELKSWAVVHIEKSDIPLGSFLHNHKVTNATSD